MTESTVLSKYAKSFNKNQFLALNEEMSFGEYLERLQKNPKWARNSFQYMYDMIVAKGVEDFERYRKTYRRYKFFHDDPDSPVFGLEETLDGLVNFIQGAAGGYGTEKRILLLHGPVGSAKSTICRIIKRGLERYSKTNEGAWYTFKWVKLPVGDADGLYTSAEDVCPMNQDPLVLMPTEMRKDLLKELNHILVEQTPEDKRKDLYKLSNDQELNPRCKLFMTTLLKRYDGDWEKVINEHIRVVRRVHSEIDRVGIGTFQPKDEKNQDSTELTGDMNFNKIAHFGADSDPRAFNFDGELCVSNRGFMEFIEILKLANEFLYDVLGVTQEHQIKPKKFSQIVVDEVLIGHSVHEDTPVPHLYDGVLDVLPIKELVNLDRSKLRVFSVNEETGEVQLSLVNNVFSHTFEGEWIENEQDGDVVTTTPNHSLYTRNEGELETFYPGEDDESEVATFELPLDLVLNYPKTERWEVFYSEPVGV